MSRALLHHRCTIERATESDDRGYISKTWAEQETGVPCKLHEKKGTFENEITGEKLEVDGTCYFQRDQDIKPRHAEDIQDRIIMTTPSSPGGTFLVVFVQDQAGRTWKRGLLKAVVKRVLPEIPPA